MDTTTVETSTLCALQPIDLGLNRVHGLMLYHLLSGEANLLANPELPVFSSPEAAIKHLHRGTQPPLSCTRVLPLSSLPRTVRCRLPPLPAFSHLDSTSNAYPINSRFTPAAFLDKILVVSDLPIISDAHNPRSLLDTVKRFKGLPCLTSTIAAQLLVDPLFVQCKDSIMWGLPSLTARRFTKAGKPVGSPQAAVNARRDAWLAARGSTLPLREFFDLLSPRLRLHHGHPGFLSGHYSPHNYSRHVDLGPSGCCWAYRNRLSPTWADLANYAADDASALASWINSLFSSHEKIPGPCRSPLIYLHKFHRPLVLSSLALFHPHLPSLTSYPDPDHRLGSLKCGQNAASLKYLYNALYRLARRMGCTSYPTPDQHPLPSESP